MYHQNVMQLRRRIAGLRKQLGYKGHDGNEDIFGERPVKPIPWMLKK